jgi:hypothetical protein
MSSAPTPAITRPASNSTRPSWLIQAF